MKKIWKHHEVCYRLNSVSLISQKFAHVFLLVSLQNAFASGNPRWYGIGTCLASVHRRRVAINHTDNLIRSFFYHFVDDFLVATRLTLGFGVTSPASFWYGLNFNTGCRSPFPLCLGLRRPPRHLSTAAAGATAAATFIFSWRVCSITSPIPLLCSADANRNDRYARPGGSRRVTALRGGRDL